MHVQIARSFGVHIAWGLCDAGNVIPTDSEFVFYGVLDLLAKPVFLFLHLFALRKVPYETFQLQSGHYSAYASIANGVVSHTGDSHVATGVRGLEKVRGSDPIAMEQVGCKDDVTC